MRFPLTEELRDEAERFALRSACRHCFFFVAAEERCAHEWPLAARTPGGHDDRSPGVDDRGQQRWPLPAEAGGEVDFCKEFELA